METQDIYLTPEGRQRHLERLEHLLSVKRPEIADYIHEAKESGDVTDNATYEDAKNQQARIEAEIARLQRLLSSAKELKMGPGGDEITLGSHVHLRTENNREVHYAIVGPDEANPSEGRISNESPVGSALIGHKAGDHVTVSTPSGVRTYTVLDLE
jgi:transcription elongation factor GreA